MAAGGECAAICSACKRCKAKPVNGLKCQNCASLFHVSCAKLMKLKIINDNTVICCETDLKSNEEPIAVDDVSEILNINIVDVEVFRYILKQKNALINELKDKINILTAHIDLQNKFIYSKETAYPKNSNAQQKPNAFQRDDKENNILSRQTSANIKQQVTIKEVNNAIKQAEKNIELNSTNENKSNLNDNEENENTLNVQQYYANTQSQFNEDDQKQDGHWTIVKTKEKQKRSRPNPIQGNKILTGNNTTYLKIAEKKSWLFVTGLDANTEAKEIECYLNDQGIQECIIEKLKTKSDRYKSSFKLSVPMNLKETVMDPSFWPVGVSVNHFLNLQRRLEALNKGIKQNS